MISFWVERRIPYAMCTAPAEEEVPVTRTETVRHAAATTKESVRHAAAVAAPYAGTAKDAAVHYAGEARKRIAPKVSSAAGQARDAARAQYDAYPAERGAGPQRH